MNTVPLVHPTPENEVRSEPKLGFDSFNFDQDPSMQHAFNDISHPHDIELKITETKQEEHPLKVDLLDSHIHQNHDEVKEIVPLVTTEVLPVVETPEDKIKAKGGQVVSEEFTSPDITIPNVAPQENLDEKKEETSREENPLHTTGL